jgi:hypothetical protein
MINIILYIDFVQISTFNFLNNCSVFFWRNIALQYVLILTLAGTSLSVATSLIVRVGRVCSGKLRCKVTHPSAAVCVFCSHEFCSWLEVVRGQIYRHDSNRRVAFFFNRWARKLSHKCPMNWIHVPDLRDDNIADDIECAKRVYKMHGFSGWYGWLGKCQSSLPDLSKCRWWLPWV